MSFILLYNLFANSFTNVYLFFLLTPDPPRRGKCCCFLFLSRDRPVVAIVSDPAWVKPATESRKSAEFFSESNTKQNTIFSEPNNVIIYRFQVLKKDQIFAKKVSKNSELCCQILK